MRIEVVVPATRDAGPLIESLARQDRPPDLVTIVSNEHSFGPWPLDVRIIGFRSEAYCYGEKDAALRRNIGLWASDADAIIFQDDDLIAPANMVSSAERLLADHDLVWGHHRYIDFEAHPLDELMTLDPSAGREREHPPNHEHGHWSCYAGMLAGRRDALLELQGFDMLFLGRHGSEDQNLGYRWLQSRGQTRAFIWEPPFSWHPTTDDGWGQLVTNSCGSHELETELTNGAEFLSCTRCPYRTAGPSAPLFGGSVVLPFDPALVETSIKET